VEDKQMERQRFEFSCDGDRLVGILYLPDDDPRAALVTTGPLTSVKEQAAGAYAKALAERGYASLAFDHRTFGESEGRPRQFENPTAKVADIRAAVSALQNQPSIRGLPLAAVGVCAGAGYMARAVAEEKRFGAFAGVAGYYAEFTEASLKGAAPRIERGRVAERAWRETGVAETIPAVAPDGGDVAMPLREAYEFYGTARGAVSNYLNAFAVQSFAYTTPFDAVGAAPLIDAPTLVVHSENALAPALARKFIAGLHVPVETSWLTSSGQIDFYDDPALIGQAADLIAAFLDRVLQPSRPGHQKRNAASH
jgi:fermentation-respiration switch protein FrsA (DUF1100 family)